MATRADVARLAGVSPSTVTYALSGERRIADKTRQRVLSAASELGYHPHALAQGLAGGRSRNIGLLFPAVRRVVNASDVEYLIGASEAARELGYRVLLWTTDPADAAELAQLVGTLLVDGFLLLEVHLNDRRVEFLREYGSTFALIGRTAQPDDLLYSDRDFAEAGRVAIEHLAGLGHRRVALLGSPTYAQQMGLAAVDRSEKGVLDAARAAGVEVDVVHAEATVDAGRATFGMLAAMPAPPTAVVCLNDEATIGLYQGAQIHQRRIPDDLSVLSLTISVQRADYFYPPLTAIHPPAKQIGASAARALIGRLTGNPTGPGQSLWAGDLVSRGSTAPPARPIITGTSA